MSKPRIASHEQMLAAMHRDIEMLKRRQPGPPPTQSPVIRTIEPASQTIGTQTPVTIASATIDDPGWPYHLTVAASITLSAIFSSGGPYVRHYIQLDASSFGSNVVKQFGNYMQINGFATPVCCPPFRHPVLLSGSHTVYWVALAYQASASPNSSADDLLTTHIQRG